MILRRLLFAAVVLLSLALLHCPQLAHAVVIVQDSLTAINGSIATYNVSSRELLIAGTDAFKVTLAAPDPVFSIDVNFTVLSEDGHSTIAIASAEFLQDLSKADCKWEIRADKWSRSEEQCYMTFTLDFADLEGEWKNCSDTDFNRLQVNMSTEQPTIFIGDKEGKERLRKRLRNCTEMRPTNYTQSIQNSNRTSSDITYVWEIAVQKTSESAFLIRLPNDTTPVRLDPDPPTPHPVHPHVHGNYTDDQVIHKRVVIEGYKNSLLEVILCCVVAPILLVVIGAAYFAFLTWLTP